MNNPSASSSRERRQFPRVKYSIDVDWGDTPACIYRGRVTTLSVGGCFVQTPLEAAKGGLIFIRLLVAPASERVMEGVVWGRVAYNMPVVGLGVEFQKLPTGYEEHIRDLVGFLLESGEEA